MQKELVLHFPKKKKFSHSVQSAITHSQSFRGYHNASLLLSPQVSLRVAPFLGAPRRWSVSSSTHWGRTWLGTGPRALPDPVTIPGESVRPSNEYSWGLAIRRVRTLVRKRTKNAVSGVHPHSSRGSFAPAQPSHQFHGSRGWHGWNLTRVLQKPVIKKPGTTLGDLGNLVYYAGRPRGINTPSSEPQTKGLQSFYRQTTVGNTGC